MGLTYIKPEKLRLKHHLEFNEKWLCQRIKDDPSLGLGEAAIKDVERLQPYGGRLDLLLYDLESERRYEVELQLGTVDESHIMRCIEYWDLERKRYPQYEHRIGRSDASKKLPDLPSKEAEFVRGSSRSWWTEVTGPRSSRLPEWSYSLADASVFTFAWQKQTSGNIGTFCASFSKKAIEGEPSNTRHEKEHLVRRCTLLGGVREGWGWPSTRASFTFTTN